MRRLIVRCSLTLPAVLLAAAALADPQPRSTPPPDAVSDYLAAWNGAAERLGGALAPEFVDNTTLLPGNAAAFAAQLHAWREAVPDLRVTLIDRARAPGKEVLRLRYSGTPAHPEELLPLTGGRIEMEQWEWLTTKAGRIVGRRAAPDDWTIPPEFLSQPPRRFPWFRCRHA